MVLRDRAILLIGLENSGPWLLTKQPSNHFILLSHHIYCSHWKQKRRTLNRKQRRLYSNFHSYIIFGKHIKSAIRVYSCLTFNGSHFQRGRLSTSQIEGVFINPHGSTVLSSSLKEATSSHAYSVRDNLPFHWKWTLTFINIPDHWIALGDAWNRNPTVLYFNISRAQ